MNFLSPRELRLFRLNWSGSTALNSTNNTLFAGKLVFAGKVLTKWLDGTLEVVLAVEYENKTHFVLVREVDGHLADLCGWWGALSRHEHEEGDKDAVMQKIEDKLRVHKRARLKLASG